MIEARGLEKAYPAGGGVLRVLKDVSFTVESGEFLAITGPSGAGKSTLLHLLAGLDMPTRGEVRWEGQSLARMSDRERSLLRNQTIGFVFQFYHLIPELTALENTMLPGLVHRRRSRRVLRRDAFQRLEQVGLAQRAGHKPRQLSGGELQRVAIARAMINQPKVMFCDEPTGNLDSQTGKAVAELLIGLQRQHGMSLVLVTHARELAHLASRQLELHDGQIVT